MIVHHPALWAANWPTGAKPYLTLELAQACNPAVTSFTETQFCGTLAEVVCESPATIPTSEHAQPDVPPVLPSVPSLDGAVAAEPAPEVTPASPVKTPSKPSKKKSHHAK